MKNQDVVNAWENGISAKTRNLSTDGKNLYSYALKIGETRGLRKYVYNYTATPKYDVHENEISSNFVSMTTSCHVGIAAFVASFAHWKEEE